MRDGEIRTFVLDAAELGAARAEPAQLAGGTPAENAERLKAVLEGEPGALADIVAVNAGAALYVAGEVEDLAEGFARARELLLSGAAAAKLEELKNFK